MTRYDFSSGLSSAGTPDPEQQTAKAGRGGRSDPTHQTATISPPETESKYVSVIEHMAKRRKQDSHSSLNVSDQLCANSSECVGMEKVMPFNFNKNIQEHLKAVYQQS